MMKKVWGLLQDSLGMYYDKTEERHKVKISENEREFITKIRAPKREGNGYVREIDSELLMHDFEQTLRQRQGCIQVAQTFCERGEYLQARQALGQIFAEIPAEDARLGEFLQKQSSVSQFSLMEVSYFNDALKVHHGVQLVMNNLDAVHRLGPAQQRFVL